MELDIKALKGARILVDQVTKMAMLCPLDMASELVSAESHMETVLPFLDPTSYIHNQTNMRIRDEQFRAFLTFRHELERIKNRWT